MCWLDAIYAYIHEVYICNYMYVHSFSQVHMYVHIYMYLLHVLAHIHACAYTCPCTYMQGASGVQHRMAKEGVAQGSVAKGDEAHGVCGTGG